MFFDRHAVRHKNELSKEWIYACTPNAIVVAKELIT